jgi:GNAT superfamily N-acetyltransferase
MTDIRPARAQDVDDLVAMMREFYRESGLALTSTAAARAFRTLLDNRSLGRVWLLESDGRSAGYVALTLCFSLEFGGTRGFVEDLFVRRAARNLGLGTAALQVVKQCCHDLGIRALVVETSQADVSARRLFASAGFEPRGLALLACPLAQPLHR